MVEREPVRAASQSVSHSPAAGVKCRDRAFVAASRFPLPKLSPRDTPRAPFAVEDTEFARIPEGNSRLARGQSSVGTPSPIVSGDFSRGSARRT